MTLRRLFTFAMTPIQWVRERRRYREIAAAQEAWLKENGFMDDEREEVDERDLLLRMQDAVERAIDAAFRQVIGPAMQWSAERGLAFVVVMWVAGAVWSIAEARPGPILAMVSLSTIPFSAWVMASQLKDY